jgi:hypothetical protein
MKSKLIVLVSLTFVLIGCQQPNKAKARSIDIKKTNIVMILSDDLAWNDYGFMGSLKGNRRFNISIKNNKQGELMLNSEQHACAERSRSMTYEKQLI